MGDLKSHKDQIDTCEDKRGMKEREKEEENYLCKHNGSTTPLWARTHVQNDMTKLHGTPIPLVMSELKRALEKS